MEYVYINVVNHHFTCHKHLITSLEINQDRAEHVLMMDVEMQVYQKLILV